MKLSFVVSLQKTKFESISAGPWEEKIRLLSKLGYEGVELAIRDPKQIKIKRIEIALNKNNLELCAIGSGQAYVDDGLALSSLRDDIRSMAIDRLKEYIDLARIFNTRVIIGLIRGKKEIEGYDSKFNDNLYDSFRYICDYASSKNVIIAVEPINRYETDFFNTVDETIRFIKKFKCKNLRILLDTFHMNIEEKNFITPIQKAKNYLSHFHIADSNRRYPGEGHIDFSMIIEELKKIGYGGYLSGEILPIPDFNTCAKKYLINMKRCINSR